MLLSVSLLVPGVLSVALFGKRSRPDDHGEPVGAASEPAAPASGSMADVVNQLVGADAPPPPDEPATAAPADATADATPEGDGEAPPTEDEALGLLDDAQRADLAARQASTEPTPHPIRARELWHPPVEPDAPVAAGLDPAQDWAAGLVADSDEPAGGGPRFRFNRLKKVNPDGVDDEAAESTWEPPVPDEPGYDVAFEDLFSNDRAPQRRQHLGTGRAPLVPPADGTRGALLNGPVGRSRSRQMGGRGVRGPLPVLGMTPDDLDHTWIRGDVEPQAAEDGTFEAVVVSPEQAERVDGDGPAEAGTDVPTLAAAIEVEVGETPTFASAPSWVDGPPPAPPVITPAPAPVEPVVDAVVEPMAEPVIEDRVDAPVDVDVDPVRDDPTSDDPTPDDPEAESDRLFGAWMESGRDAHLTLREIPIGADGTVPAEGGSVRVADPAAAVAEETLRGITVDLTGGWCWTALGVDGPEVVVRAGAINLSVPPETTALTALDDDGSKLVVVLQGEAVLVHAGGRMRLRRGAMVFLPIGSDPQVDVGSDEEILSDPIVAHNVALDAAR